MNKNKLKWFIEGLLRAYNIMPRLAEGQNKRATAVYIFKEFLDGMVEGEKKQMGFRKWFYRYLINGSETLFTNDDEEYNYISKFGRGAWDDEQLKKTFTKKEMETVVSLAKAYGAFDY